MSTLALGVIALTAILVFVGFMIYHERRRTEEIWRRTRQQIRELPTFSGHGKARK